VAGTEVLRGRVVDAATRRPLESVQVFVPELSAGALSDSTGSFNLDLPGAALDSVASSLTVEAQLIGYGRETRRLDLTRGDTGALEFELRPTAIALDEMVVTTGRQVRADAETAPPLAIDFAESAAWPEVGDAAAGTDRPGEAPALPDIAVLATRRETVSGIGVTRVDQRLDDGTAITVFAASHPMSIPNRPDDANFAQLRLGDRWVAAIAALDEAALREQLARIR
jgi:hypothetical protein